MVREEKKLNQQQQQKNSLKRNVYIFAPYGHTSSSHRHKGRSLGKVSGTEKMREINPIHTCPWPHVVTFQSKWGKKENDVRFAQPGLSPACICHSSEKVTEVQGT